MKTFTLSKIAPLACLLLVACSSHTNSSATDGGTGGAGGPDGGSSATCAPNAAGYDPHIDPANFSTTIDNKYLFYKPGQVFKYTNNEGDTVLAEVMTDTKMILGVKTVVVHDSLKSKTGELLEDTYDYYAQDKAGNVWYFGEETKAYSGGKVSTAGAWIAGVKCAKPGITMKANPQAGEKYRQEFLPGEAEDEAEVVSVTASATVPYGSFTNCVMTKEVTALKPGDIANKTYCAGIGEVLTVDVGTVDGGKREDLVSVDGKTKP